MIELVVAPIVRAEVERREAAVDSSAAMPAA
jgi:hypothetical protein